MANLAKLTVQLEAQSAKLTTELEKANRKLSKFEKQGTKALRGFETAAKAAFGAFTVGAASAALKNATALADSIDKAAAKAGLSTDALQAYRFAGGQVGVTNKQIDEGFRRLSRRLGEFANSGAGPAAKALEYLNIAVKDQDGLRGTDEIFADIVKSFEGVETQAERAALAAQLFGDDAGPALELLLRQGVDGINALTDSAARSGAVIDGELIQAGVRAADAMARLDSTFTAVGNSIILNLAPQLEGLADFLSDNAPAAVEFTVDAYNDLRSILLEIAEVGARVLGAFAGQLSDAVIPGKQLSDTLENLSGIAGYFGFDEISSQLDSVQGSLEGARDAVGDITGLGEVSRSLQNVADDYSNVADNIDELGKAYDSADEKQNKFFAGVPGKVLVPSIGLQGAGDVARLKEHDKKQADAVSDSTKKIKAAIDDATGPYSEWLELQKEAARLFEAVKTPAEEFAEEIERIGLLFDRGLISEETANRAIQAASDGFSQMAEKMDEVSSQMSEFGVQAARSIQGSLADFLFDPFGQGLDDMLKGFQQTLQRMAAEAASQKILESLFSIGASAFGGSAFGDFLGSFAVRHMGGPVAAGTPYVVGGREPELFIPSQSGKIIPQSQMQGASVNQTNNFNINGQVDKRTAQQIAVQVGTATRAAIRRNT